MNKFKTAIIICISLGVIVMAVGLGVLLSGGKSGSAKLEKNVEDYLRDADRYLEDSKYEMASVTYKKVLDIDEDNTSAIKGMSNCQHYLNYYDEEIESRRKLEELDDSDIENKVALAQALIKVGELDTAKEYVANIREEIESEELDYLYADMNIITPELTVPSGTYPEYQYVTLSGETESAIVYYTTDGSEPTRDSAPLTEGIIISYPETVIKIKAIGYLGYEGKTKEYNYTITAPVEEVYKSLNRYDDFLNKVGYDILKKRPVNEIYNYELAQITSLYYVGEYRLSVDGTDVGFNQNGYTCYQSLYTDKGKSDLSGIKYMPYLKTLALDYQEDVDLEIISELKYLEELSLINDEITDISPLSRLSGLKKLNLACNEISDISALSSMTELTSLGLWANNISDVNCLSGLGKLVYFDISDNDVSDIGVVASMPELSELWIYNNNVTSLAPAKGLDLSTLMVAGNPINDYSVWSDRACNLVKTDIDN